MMTTNSSSGIGCDVSSSASVVSEVMTHTSIHSQLLGLVDVFRLDQEKSMIKQETHQVGNLVPVPASALEWTLVYELSAFVS